jgi:uncharacterized low-complexity protein
MSRLLLVLACAFALSFAAPLSFDNSAEAAAKAKICRAKAPNGKKMTWRCGADQACCVNQSTGKGVCGMPGLGCL